MSISRDSPSAAVFIRLVAALDAGSCSVRTVPGKMQRFWRMQRSTTLSNDLSIVEMNVHMDCDGCEKRVRKAMSRLEGVSLVEIDMERQKVTVRGYVELRAARRTGRAAEFWPWPYDGEYYPFAIRYLVDDTYMTTDRYYRHGYNDPIIGSYPCHAFTHVIDDHALAVFHEDCEKFRGAWKLEVTQPLSRVPVFTC